MATSLADMGPTFEKDQDGSAIIDLPQEYWKNKTYRSLKIHLSKEVLQNLTGKRFHENEVKQTKEGWYKEISFKSVGKWTLAIFIYKLIFCCFFSKMIIRK